MNKSHFDNATIPPPPGDSSASTAKRNNRAALWATWGVVVIGLAVILPVEFHRGQEDGWAAWLTSIHSDTTLPLVVFLLLPLAWWIRKRPRPAPRRLLRNWFGAETKPNDQTRRADRLRALVLAGLVAAVSWLVNAKIGAMPITVTTADSQQVIPLRDLPPALHDEYSYLFQAHTFLAGRVAFSSHPEFPSLFDQMHVLNDRGVFAGRYFPGTALWMAPFVALENPHWGHWLAGALSAAFVFLIGRELAGNAVGLFAGLLTAVSPGILLFGQLLVAHHPAMLGLTFFAWTFLRMQRTGSSLNAGLAGAGLIFATLCRPMTAAGIGFPFGVWLLIWWIRGQNSSPARFRQRSLLVGSMAVPISLGIGGMMVYNHQLTGSVWTSPYQLYTDIYTPRHVYGFYNVDRAASNTSDKVIENYDQWAENLTPALAVQNVQDRLIASGQWVLGLVPLAMVMAVFPFIGGRKFSAPVLADRRWWLIFLAIFSLHLAHVPYWYVGIRYWHYVFEAAPFILLIYAGVSGYLIAAWCSAGRVGLVAWWMILLACAFFIAYGSWPPMGPVSRFEAALGEDIWARKNHFVFNDMLERRIQNRPALVLIAQDPADRHIDYVTNIPPLDQPILRGRFRPQKTPLDQVLQNFPGRSVYAVILDPQEEKKILRGQYSRVRFVRLAEEPLVSATAVVYRLEDPGGN